MSFVIKLIIFIALRSNPPLADLNVRASCLRQLATHNGGWGLCCYCFQADHILLSKNKRCSNYDNTYRGICRHCGTKENICKHIMF